MRVDGRFVIVFATVAVVVGLLLFVGPATDGRGAESAPASSPPESSEEQQARTDREEREQIEICRREHHMLVNKIVSRLRKFQGIPGPASALSGRPLSDVRLSDARLEYLAGDRDTPATISDIEEDWILLAGQLGIAECSNLLLNRIASGKEKVAINARHMLPPNPALHALLQIGEPACREALARIPLEADKRRCANMVLLLQYRLGLSTARSRLVELQNKSVDREQYERVGIALGLLEQKIAE
jgi:hypothetical protein